MKTKAVIDWFGTQQKTADALGLHQSTVSGWGDEPPELRQIQIERLSNGELQAEPRCYQPKAKTAA